MEYGGQAAPAVWGLTGCTCISCTKVWLAANFYIHFGWEIRIPTAAGMRQGSSLKASDPTEGLLNFFDYAEWKGGPEPEPCGFQD